MSVVGIVGMAGAGAARVLGAVAARRVRRSVGMCIVVVVDVVVVWG
jgi:hypothetical protein